jgi:hypothetical protein
MTMAWRRQDQARQPKNYRELPDHPDPKLDVWWLNARESIRGMIEWVVDQLPKRVTTVGDGLAPRLPGDSNKFLAGDGEWRQAQTEQLPPLNHTHAMSEVFGLVEELERIENVIGDMPPALVVTEQPAQPVAATSYMPGGW